MLSFDSKRATITESETYAQGFLTHPLSFQFVGRDKGKSGCGTRAAAL
jgi:hypothetical protein